MPGSPQKLVRSLCPNLVVSNVIETIGPACLVATINTIFLPSTLLKYWARRGVC